MLITIKFLGIIGLMYLFFGLPFFPNNTWNVRSPTKREFIELGIGLIIAELLVDIILTILIKF